MKTKRLLFIQLLLAVSSLGYAQIAQSEALKQSISVQSKDSTSIPSIAELKAQILQSGSTNSSSNLDVPSEHRALFCRFDDKLDKKGIPLRMRLGSLEETNRMEAKPGYRVGQLPQ